MQWFYVLVVVVSPVWCEVNWDVDWTSWKSQFNKKYSNETEELYRRALWKQNVLEVMKHNQEAAAGRHSFTMGTNQFSDLTEDEAGSKMNCLRLSHSDQDAASTFNVPSSFSQPSQVDWRSEGYVTPVQNQGNCHSCWAFSAVGALEAQMKKKTGKLFHLSEQNLVDCSESRGCSGGNPIKAFNYIIQKGIALAKHYPYTAKEQYCHYSQKYKAGTCSRYEVLPKNEAALMSAVANHGPVSMAVNAEPNSFKHYKSGIYRDYKCNKEKLTHAMLVVGYRKTPNESYWLIKNSWGTEWGEKGYMRMAQGIKQCGIANFAVIPYA